MTLIAGENDGGRRLDRVLRKAMPDAPLSLLHRLLRQGRVFVDGSRAEGGTRVSAGAEIALPEAGFSPPAETRPRGGAGGSGPETAPRLNIVFENADLLILDKPSGIPVHGPGGLDAPVRAYLAEKIPASLSFRPGPLHRLDRPASGLLVFSASLGGAKLFSDLLRRRRIRKRYLALVEGASGGAGPAAGGAAPDSPWEIWEDSLRRNRETGVTEISRTGAAGTKTARTRAKTLFKTEAYSLLLLEIGTGRPHQIRSHAAFHGHPLAGDRKYGGHPFAEGLFLHAASLGFPALESAEREMCPETAADFSGKTFTAPLPRSFRAAILRIFGKPALETVNSGKILI